MGPSECAKAALTVLSSDMAWIQCLQATESSVSNVLMEWSGTVTTDYAQGVHYMFPLPFYVGVETLVAEKRY